MEAGHQPTTSAPNGGPNGDASNEDAKDASSAPPDTVCDAAGAQGIDAKANTPADFAGAVDTNDDLPGAALLKKVEGYNVLDKDGKTHPFRSLWTGPNVARRMLVIFIRHFFCGNCQEYIRSLVESVTPASLLALPVPTFIAIVGCGDPRLIGMYADATSCPFPIYTDPSAQLFRALGMTRTFEPGERPAYMKKGLLGGALTSVKQGLGQVASGLALKSGDFKQVGGEFLFEPLDISTPISTPPGEGEKTGLDAGLMMDGGYGGGDLGGGQGGRGEVGEDKRVSWCHRMRTTRDHAEIPELMEVLGLDGHGKPVKDETRWQKAVQSRKGRGMSMAGEMDKLKQQEQL